MTLYTPPRLTFAPALDRIAASEIPWMQAYLLGVRRNLHLGYLIEQSEVGSKLGRNHIPQLSVSTLPRSVIDAMWNMGVKTEFLWKDSCLDTSAVAPEALG
jgi:hypothetical protein